MGTQARPHLSYTPRDLEGDISRADHSSIAAPIRATGSCSLYLRGNGMGRNAHCLHKNNSHSSFCSKENFFCILFKSRTLFTISVSLHSKAAICGIKTQVLMCYLGATSTNVCISKLFLKPGVSLSKTQSNKIKAFNISRSGLTPCVHISRLTS